MRIIEWKGRHLPTPTSHSTASAEYLPKMPRGIIMVNCSYQEKGAELEVAEVA